MSFTDCNRISSYKFQILSIQKKDSQTDPPVDLKTKRIKTNEPPVIQEKNHYAQKSKKI